MKTLPALFLALASLAQAEPTPLRSIPVGPNPESVTRGFGGDLFVSLMGENRKDGDGDGRIVRVTDGAVAVFSAGLDDPKGLAFTGEHLITADFTRVWRIDAQGKRTLLAGPADFPHPPVFLNDVALAPDGRSVFVTDMGALTKMRNPQGQLWPVDSAEAAAIPVIARVYRITLDGQVSIAIDAQPAMLLPNGVAAPAADTLLVAEFFTGRIMEHRRGEFRVLSTGHRGADGIARDSRGTLYVSEVFTGKVWSLPAQGEKKLLATLESAADFLLDEPAGLLLVPDSKAGKLVMVPTGPR
ncbi:MAG: SMP-30/gluconolactonase/LRE family protein [Lacunisphaera sp.]|nr:SMP-30/gluconolactonase/LRE family protein [Lacunisphaera sp.]